MGSLTHGIVGREAEMALVDDVMALVPEGPAAVIVDGEVGIGKTRLWTEGVAVMEGHTLAQGKGVGQPVI